MKFPQEFIEKVSEANNLVDIISQYTQLKPTGGGLMGRCPFPDHPEKTPSFSVSETKQVYNCFGCHKKGNIFTFLQHYNGMSFKEAIEYLADRAHITIPQFSETQNAKVDLLQAKRKAMAQANAVAVQHFRDNFKKLSANHLVREYAKKRGLTDEIIDTFQIGYSSEAWEGLVNEFSNRKISLQLAEEAKLVKARTNGKSGYFDLFRERLMFPIFSMMGEPIAFGGRIIAQGEPKYLNSPETPLFHKGKVLYGLSQTAKFIRSEDQAIVVEGYMDLVSLYQAGITNVVATMGTALTADHGKMLSRITKNVVVLFDGDSAGIEASERGLPILLGSDVYPKGLTLPNDQDPDDFVKSEGADALRKLVANATDLFSLVLHRWLQGYRGEASEKVRISSRLQPIFAAIQDVRLKSLYLKEAAQKMNVDEKWLRESLVGSKNDYGQKSVPWNTPDQSQRPVAGSVSHPMQNSVQSTAQSEKKDQEQLNEVISLKGASPAEKLLIGLILKNHANFEVFDQACSLDNITHLGISEVLKRISEVARQVPEKFDKLVSLLTNFVDQPEVLIADNRMDSDDTKLILDCVKKIKEKRILEKRTQLTKELKTSVAGSEHHQQLMKALMDLKKEELEQRR